MTAPIRVRAPATTANLGPGFDCAAVALDLWNEVEVSAGDGVEIAGEGERELPRGPDHLALRAFALLAPVDARRFAFTNRIPLYRGLGSSAAAIALGLVAAALVEGRRPEPEVLLPLGAELEGHADNLAAALVGGACLTWAGNGRPRLARVAEGLPLAPIAVVPEARVATAEARAALPARVAHADAAFTVGHAALLGAGLVSGNAELLAEAFEDRLHEPYRARMAPLLAEIRAALPAGAAAATLSGSGPSVIVWSERERAASCSDELRGRFPAARVLALDIAPVGAGPAT